MLLSDTNVKFLLTEHFCQDALESYFGEQRSRGGRSVNPNVQQFCTIANVLRVSGGLSAKERGNVRGREVEAPNVTTDSTHLALRKRKQSRDKQHSTRST